MLLTAPFDLRDQLIDPARFIQTSHDTVDVDDQLAWQSGRGRDGDARMQQRRITIGQAQDQGGPALCRRWLSTTTGQHAHGAQQQCGQPPRNPSLALWLLRGSRVGGRRVLGRQARH